MSYTIGPAWGTRSHLEMARTTVGLRTFGVSEMRRSLPTDGVGPEVRDYKAGFSPWWPLVAVDCVGVYH